MPSRTATDEESLSFAEVADAMGLRVDRLRLLVRWQPKLAAMFKRVGSTRILRPSRLERLREMLDG